VIKLVEHPRTQLNKRIDARALSGVNVSAVNGACCLEKMPENRTLQPISISKPDIERRPDVTSIQPRLPKNQRMKKSTINARNPGNDENHTSKTVAKQYHNRTQPT